MRLDVSFLGFVSGGDKVEDIGVFDASVAKSESTAGRV
jgi:hypothetical protein